MDPQPSPVWGSYEVAECIGKGSYGKVYKVRGPSWTGQQGHDQIDVGCRMEGCAVGGVRAGRRGASVRARCRSLPTRAYAGPQHAGRRALRLKEGTQAATGLRPEASSCLGWGGCAGGTGAKLASGAHKLKLAGRYSPASRHVEKRAGITDGHGGRAGGTA
jgi:hypothetical protein